MSEFINNREYRQKVLKELIAELHNGKSVEDIKSRFEELIKGISTLEISEMENALIKEGMPVEEIQRLCDVHAAVFKGSIEEIHRPEREEEIQGHPVHTFKLENRKIEAFIKRRLKLDLDAFKEETMDQNAEVLSQSINEILNIDKHYSRKENLLFPYMEKYGIIAPPKVMWGVDDEIRDCIKKVKKLLSNFKENRQQIIENTEEAIRKITEMIFKEENILFPMVLETLTQDEWSKIAQESAEIGYTFIETTGIWEPKKVDVTENKEVMDSKAVYDENIKFDAGFLTPEEINAMLNTLPLDITFVDKDNGVKYFSQGKERIFARPKTIIGRQVSNCHPPASVHIVEKIVEDLKSGKKDNEDFWIKMGDKYVYIRYFAVRNDKGEFLGTMEVTQDIKPIQELSGEKRLMSEL